MKKIILCLLIASGLIYYSTDECGELTIQRPKEIKNITNEEIIQAYNELPEPVKQLFKDSGCKIKVKEEIKNRDDIAGIFYHNDLIGFCKIVIIKDVNRINEVVFHEIGHLVDWGYNREYESEEYEFMRIYYQEKDDFVTDYNYRYAISNPTEYFASAFAEYMINPERLKENTPLTYNYIVKVINNIE